MSIRTADNRAKFKAHVDKLRREGKCQCIDHLRSEGFTPPRSERRSHPRLSPHGVFGEDEMGEPVLTEGKGARHGGSAEENNEAGGTLEEKSHLKHAIANRDVI